MSGTVPPHHSNVVHTVCQPTMSIREKVERIGKFIIRTVKTTARQIRMIELIHSLIKDIIVSTSTYFFLTLVCRQRFCTDTNSQIVKWNWEPLTK